MSRAREQRHMLVRAAAYGVMVGGAGVAGK